MTAEIRRIAVIGAGLKMVRAGRLGRKPGRSFFSGPGDRPQARTDA